VGIHENRGDGASGFSWAVESGASLVRCTPCDWFGWYGVLRYQGAGVEDDVLHRDFDAVTTGVRVSMMPGSRLHPNLEILGGALWEQTRLLETAPAVVVSPATPTLAADRTRGVVELADGLTVEAPRHVLLGFRFGYMFLVGGRADPVAASVHRPDESARANFAFTVGGIL
jgi:hypothetical protein